MKIFSIQYLYRVFICCAGLIGEYGNNLSIFASRKFSRRLMDSQDDAHQNFSKKNGFEVYLYDSNNSSSILYKDKNTHNIYHDICSNYVSDICLDEYSIFISKNEATRELKCLQNNSNKNECHNNRWYNSLDIAKKKLKCWIEMDENKLYTKGRACYFPSGAYVHLGIKLFNNLVRNISVACNKIIKFHGNIMCLILIQNAVEKAIHDRDKVVDSSNTNKNITYKLSHKPGVHNSTLSKASAFISQVDYRWFAVLLILPTMLVVLAKVCYSRSIVAVAPQAVLENISLVAIDDMINKRIGDLET